MTKDLENKISILNGAKCFSSGIFQNYLVFMQAKKCIKYFSGTTRIDLWISDGMSEENIENITISKSDIAPTFVDHHLLPDITFNGQILHYNCLFGSVKLTKNSDPDKYKCSDCGIGFDSRSEFLFTERSMGRIVIISGADTSSSMCILIKKIKMP